jgi:hypothetical protein
VRRAGERENRRPRSLQRVIAVQRRVERERFEERRAGHLPAAGELRGPNQVAQCARLVVMMRFRLMKPLAAWKSSWMPLAW